MKNWNCDGENCVTPDSEVRILPRSRGANDILCRACYESEIEYRRERNAAVGHQAFELPAWDDLKVYQPE